MVDSTVFVDHVIIPNDAVNSTSDEGEDDSGYDGTTLDHELPPDENMFITHSRQVEIKLVGK